MSLLSSLASLESTLKTDLLAAVGKPVLASLASVEANPTIANVVAQKVVVAGALIGAVPTLESEGIAAIAGWLTSEISPVVNQAAANTAQASGTAAGQIAAPGT